MAPNTKTDDADSIAYIAVVVDVAVVAVVDAAVAIGNVAALVCWRNAVDAECGEGDVGGGRDIDSHSKDIVDAAPGVDNDGVDAGVGVEPDVDFVGWDELAEVGASSTFDDSRMQLD